MFSFRSRSTNLGYTTPFICWSTPLLSHLTLSIIEFTHHRLWTVESLASSFLIFSYQYWIYIIYLSSIRFMNYNKMTKPILSQLGSIKFNTFKIPKKNNCHHHVHMLSYLQQKFNRAPCSFVHRPPHWLVCHTLTFLPKYVIKLIFYR